MIEVFPFGRWSGDAHDYIAVKGKLATAAWIEKSSFEKIPHGLPLAVNETLVLNGLYLLPN